MNGEEIGAIVLAVPVALYVARGERMVAQHRRESEQHLRNLIGRRVRLTLSGRVLWTVSGIVESVDRRAVGLRNEAGVVDRVPLVMIREIERSSARQSRGGNRIALRKQPWWRSRSTWPRPGTRAVSQRR